MQEGGITKNNGEPIGVDELYDLEHYDSDGEADGGSVFPDYTTEYFPHCSQHCFLRPQVRGCQEQGWVMVSLGSPTMLQMRMTPILPSRMWYGHIILDPELT